MAARFITLEQANEHVRAGLDDEISDSPMTDPQALDLELKLEQAEGIILDYLKIEEDSPEWEPPSIQLRNLQAAILLMVGHLWDSREALARVGTPSWSDPLADDGAIANLLRRMRDPTLA